MISNIYKWINYLVYGLVIGVPLVYLKVGVYPQIVPKTALFQLITGLIFSLWLGKVFLEKKVNLSSTPMLRGVLLFGGVLVVASIFGLDPWRSFWSLQERSLGVVTMIHGIILYVALVSFGDKINWRKIWRVSLVVSGLVGLISLIQLVKPDLLFAQEVSNFRPGSIFGNPTFMAGYLIFHVFLGLYFIFKESSWNFKNVFLRKDSWSWLEILATTFSLFGILASQTRGSMIGLVLGILVLSIGWLILNQRNNRRLLIQSFGILLIIISSGAVLISNNILSRIPLVARFQEISFSSESFVPRLAAYKASWEGFKERPFLGWGWDNFNLVYDKYYDPKVLSLGYTETRFDKPHNFILEYLVVGGLALVFAYIYLVYAYLKEAYKLNSKDEFKNIFVFLLALFIAYAIHLIFVFETIGPLLMWFLLLAWVDSSYVSILKKEEMLLSTEAEKEGSAIVVGLLLAVLIINYFISYRPVIASYNQALGYSFISTHPKEGIKYFEYAASIKQPLQWVIKRDFAALIAQTYLNRPEDIPEDVVREAVAYAEEVSREHPLDSYNHYLLVDIYNQTYNVDSDYLMKAEREAVEALKLSPNRQQILFSLAKTKSLEGDNEGALEILGQAIKLNDQVPDAYFYYGLIANLVNKKEESYQALMKSVELGRKFKNANEYAVVGNILADLGYLDDAIGVYAKGKDAYSDDLELRAKLGVAYFIKGDTEKSIKELEYLVSKINIRDVEGFNALSPILDRLGVSY